MESGIVPAVPSLLISKVPTLNVLLRSSFESIVLERVAAMSDMSEEATSSSCLRSDSTFKCSENKSRPLNCCCFALSRGDLTILLVTFNWLVGVGSGAVLVSLT